MSAERRKRPGTPPPKLNRQEAEILHGASCSSCESCRKLAEILSGKEREIDKLHRMIADGKSSSSSSSGSNNSSARIVYGHEPVAKRIEVMKDHERRLKQAIKKLQAPLTSADDVRRTKMNLDPTSFTSENLAWDHVYSTEMEIEGGLESVVWAFVHEDSPFWDTLHANEEIRNTLRESGSQTHSAKHSRGRLHFGLRFLQHWDLLQRSLKKCTGTPLPMMENSAGS